mgnify:CR=1 FL=1
MNEETERRIAESSPPGAPSDVLALCGSLRRASSNAALLRAAERLAPPVLCIECWEGIGRLPPFDPDLEPRVRDERGAARTPADAVERDDLAAVVELDTKVARADALLIACPEYARGVPGAFKNALDWLVGGDAFVAKPFVLFNASPRASHAQASLRVTLETMSGVLVEPACLSVPLAERGLDAAAIVADEALSAPIRAALGALATALSESR